MTSFYPDVALTVIRTDRRVQAALAAAERDADEAAEVLELLELREQARLRRRAARKAATLAQTLNNLAREADAELLAVSNAAELEQFRIKFLGTNGKLKDAMSLLGQVPKDQKPALGQRLNSMRHYLAAAFAARLGAGASTQQPTTTQTQEVSK